MHAYLLGLIRCVSFDFTHFPHFRVPLVLFPSVVDLGVGSARFGLSVPEVALLLEGLEGAVDANKYLFGLLRRKKKSKKTLEKEAAAKLAKQTAAAAAAAAAVAAAAAASAAAEDDSPSRKRAKLAASGEFASPEPEQPEESMMSPDGPGGDVPSPQAASPVVVDLSSSVPHNKAVASATAAAASGPGACGNAAASASVAAPSSSKKRKAAPAAAAAAGGPAGPAGPAPSSSKKQKGIMAFFGNR